MRKVDNPVQPTSDGIHEALLKVMAAMNEKQDLSRAEHDLALAMVRYFRLCEMPRDEQDYWGIEGDEQMIAWIALCLAAGL